MNFGMIGAGLVMGIAAIGSAIGIGIAGQGAIGAWKRCFMANKPAPFILTVFAGAPLTQTIYGFLLMQQMAGSAKIAENPLFFLGLGISLLSLREKPVRLAATLSARLEKASQTTSWSSVFAKL